MLQIRFSWDWFHSLPTTEEKTAIDKKQFCAVLREDGDDNAAIVQAIRGVDAPDEDICFDTLNPCVADCFLVIAWDSRFVECSSEDEGECDSDDPRENGWVDSDGLP